MNELSESLMRRFGDAPQAAETLDRNPALRALAARRTIRRYQDRPVDGADHRLYGLARDEPRRVEHVGPGLLIGLQPGDRVVQIRTPAEKVLGPCREREREGQGAGGLDCGGDPLRGQAGIVDRIGHEVIQIHNHGGNHDDIRLFPFPPEKQGRYDGRDQKM